MKDLCLCKSLAVAQIWVAAPAPLWIWLAFAAFG